MALRSEEGAHLARELIDVHEEAVRHNRPGRRLKCVAEGRGHSHRIVRVARVTTVA
jgi:hypothetical protein